MSQTETLLLFVLGACVTLFVILLFGRSIFAILGKVSGWKETRLQPTAIRELQAERDGLKAEKAMMAQKMEASINDIKMRMAEQMAEVSRSRNRLLDMGQTMKEREATILHLQEQVTHKAAQITSLQSQIEENVKSINLAYAKMAQREDEHDRMQNVLKEAQSTLVARDEKIRNLADESRALREVTLRATTGGFGADLEASLGNAKGNPLLPSSANVVTADFTPQSDFNEGYVERPSTFDTENDDVDRSMSNVLSLAERVRSLQSGMKKN
jgi:hypothetical protein